MYYTLLAIQRDTKLRISKEIVKRSSLALKEFPKEVITAEEIVRRRIQSFIRIALATSFFWLGSLISLGATAFAQAVTKDQPTKAKSSLRHRNHYKSFKHSTDPNTSMIGTASWYGHGFHNRKTASGKLFDQNALMAAHRTLPFGTLLKVTNTVNNKSCIVEVTDRGPFVKNRIIDVSRGAAQELGFADQGTTKVILQIITPTNIEYSTLQRKVPVSDVLKTPAMAVR